MTRFRAGDVVKVGSEEVMISSCVGIDRCGRREAYTVTDVDVHKTPETVAVIVASYGDPQHWSPLLARAAKSVKLQTLSPKEFIGVHKMSGTIAEIRNWAVSKATSKWLVFLDADDELEPDYIEAMMSGTGTIRYPRVRYVTDGDPVLPAPVELRRVPLAKNNYMVIGSMVPRELFVKVGGFEEFESWEDWHLFCKLVLNGATTKLCRDAVYRAHSTKTGRCNQVKDAPALMKTILDSLHPLEQSSGISLGEIH